MSMKHPHDRPYDVAYPSALNAKAVLNRLRGLVGMSTRPETEEEAAERRDATRRSLGAELAALEAKRDAELPSLAATEAKAKKRLESVTPGYQQAVADFDRAQAIHSRRAHDFAYQREMLVRRIEAAADPIIDEFMRDMAGLLEANRLTQVETDIRTIGYDIAKTKSIREEWSNVPSLNARRIAILAARNEAEGMKGEPDQSKVRERLAALVEALPDNAVLVKVDQR